MTTTAPKKLSKGQLAYEQERAKKAGKPLEEWLKAKAAPKAEKKPGLISRLIDRAHKPL